MVDAAHDLSDGGLARRWSSRACATASVPGSGWTACERDGIDPFVALFSESAGRAVVAVPRSEEVRFTDMCGARGCAPPRIGVVDGEQPLDVQGQFALPLDELREAHEATLPAAFA